MKYGETIGSAAVARDTAGHRQPAVAGKEKQQERDYDISDVSPLIAELDDCLETAVKCAV